MAFKPVALFNGSHKYILCDSFGSGTVVWVVIPVLEEDIINTGLNSFVRVFTFFLPCAFITYIIHTCRHEKEKSARKEKKRKKKI